MRWGQSCTTTAERASTLWGLLHRNASPLGSGAATHHSVCRVSQLEGMHVGRGHVCDFECTCVQVELH